MATWKEKGVVPDSDDEDSTDADSVGSPSASLHPRASRLDCTRLASGNQIVPFSPQEVGEEYTLPVLKANQLPNPSDNQIDAEPDRRSPTAITEEFSKSYVVLSSPLSSPPSSMIYDFDEERYGAVSQTNITASADRQPPRDEVGSDEHVARELEQNEFEARRRRSLRQRNPIQLHPYALEGEKYRRTLLASGMRPVRLLREGNQFAENNDSQNTDDTDFETPGGTQDPFSDPLLPSSSPMRKGTSPADEPVLNHETQHLYSDNSAGEDEEFPDIETLIKRGQKPRKSSHNNKKKKDGDARVISRIRVYSRKYLDRTTSAEPAAEDAGDIFDVLASPRADSDSSIALNINRAARSTVISVSSASSRATSMERSDFQTFSVTSEVPTPATSALKPSTEVESTIDSPYGPDSSSESSTISEAEPDEMVQLRKVGKRIRGVLPASWLRLDKQADQPKKDRAEPQLRRSKSPTVSVPRRGIAIPKALVNPPSTAHQRQRPDVFFLPEESGDEDGLSIPAKDSSGDIVMEDIPYQSDGGVSFEADQIDEMLPSRKRKSQSQYPQPPRKVRKVATSLFRAGTDHHTVQPRITDHLPLLSKPKRHTGAGQSQKPRRTHKKRLAPSTRTVKPPKLSILDVMSKETDRSLLIPDFIRVAARNARSRTSLGRQYPSQKIIRLACKEDTETAQSVLRDWKAGRIHQRPHLQSSGRPPLKTISGNRQIYTSKTSRPNNKPNSVVVSSHSRNDRRYISTKSRRSGNPRTGDKPAPTVTENDQEGHTLPRHRGKFVRPIESHAARPAQLEMPKSTSQWSHQSANFGSNIKSLNSLYRKSHKGSNIKGDIQLARFLAEESAQLRSAASATSDQHKEPLAKKPSRDTAPLRRKRPPTRLDIGAAKYRQPQDPLVLDHISPNPLLNHSSEDDHRLVGLGNFGTTYTIDFDVSPLHRGIFFHETTLIGSGRIKNILAATSKSYMAGPRGIAVFQVGNKQLRWGKWDQHAAAEVGGFFDWMVEQLEPANVGFSTSNINEVVRCLDFLVGYIQDQLSFETAADAEMCVLRFIEVAPLLLGSIESRSSSLTATDQHYLKLTELSVFGTLLLFQILQISKESVSAVEIRGKAENLFLNVANISTRLFLLDLEDIHKLWDDLQYLKFRENGIQSHRYPAQAATILWHVLQRATIPRSSFWDLVNHQLMQSIVNEKDARTLERVWYSMMTLLPLGDFDQFGVVIPRLEQKGQQENWMLVQKLCSRVFELYKFDERQSASFNDYCRALFRRCYDLVVCWGWQRCSSIIGVLFDFFATHDLAHLRHEEVYTSPAFLHQLHCDPSLTLEPQDPCFHIFLKLVATTILQLRAGGDEKGIRNLITRILPNHNRQYPREKTIHQRDLASLRNHHDLLCTLFFSAPRDLRPSVNLIRNLVNHDNSHKEASLINLRAWADLSRFLLFSDSTSREYKPLTDWQGAACEQLLSQYLSAKDDVHRQLQLIPESAKHRISEDTIQLTLSKNRSEIMESLLSILHEVGKLITASRDQRTLTLTFENLYRVFVNDRSGVIEVWRDLDGDKIDMTKEALNIIRAYTEAVNNFAPQPFDYQVNEEDDDSQTYGINVFTCGALKELKQLVEPLCGDILFLVQQMTYKCIETPSMDTGVAESVVKTWASLAKTLINSGAMISADFLAKGGKWNVFNLDDDKLQVRLYAPLFVAELLNDYNCRIDGDNMLMAWESTIKDWLVMLVKPADLSKYDYLAFIALWKTEKLAIFKELAWLNPRVIRSNAEFHELRGQIIKASFEIMHQTIRGPIAENEEFRTTAERMVVLMNQDIYRMKKAPFSVSSAAPQSSLDEHLQFVKRIVLEIRTYFPRLGGLEVLYSQTDLTLFRQQEFAYKLREYRVKLYSNQGHPQLVYYLLGTFVANIEYDVTSPRMKDMLLLAMSDEYQSGQITPKLKGRKGAAVRYDKYTNGAFSKMSQDEFDKRIVEKFYKGNIFNVKCQFTSQTTLQVTQWITADLTPSFLYGAVMNPSGWFMAKAMLDASSSKIMELGEKYYPFAFEAAITILKSIVDTMWRMKDIYSNAGPNTHLEFGHAILLAAMIRFAAAAVKPLFNCHEVHDGRKAERDEVLNAVLDFASRANIYLFSPLDQLLKIEGLQPLPSPVLPSPADDFIQYRPVDPLQIDALGTGMDRYAREVRQKVFDMKNFQNDYNKEREPHLLQHIMYWAQKCEDVPEMMDLPAFELIRHGKLPGPDCLLDGVVFPREESGPHVPDFGDIVLASLNENWTFSEIDGRVYLKKPGGNEGTKLAGDLGLRGPMLGKIIFEQLKQSTFEFCKSWNDAMNVEYGHGVKKVRPIEGTLKGGLGLMN